MVESGAFPLGGGEMGARIRAHDWAATPLGPLESWPSPLRMALDICLHSSFPTAIYWGPALHLLYNDAWASIPGQRHPDVLGKPAQEAWSDIWHILQPQLAVVMATGEGFATFDHPLPMKRGGRIEETYWNYNFAPIRTQDGCVVGILNQGMETTVRVLTERRNALIVTLADEIRLLDQVSDIVAVATARLGEALGAGRVGYGEVERKSRLVTVSPCWTDGTLDDAGGNHALGAYGPALHEAMLAGTLFVVEDSEADSRLGPAERAVFAGHGVRSGIFLPLVQHERYVGLLFVNDRRPRAWNANHQALVRAVGDRLWQGIARARSQIALRESEERHRLLFEQAHDIIFTADLDQRITAANPASARALGTTPEALIGRSVRDYLAPGAYRAASGMLRRALPSGGTTRYEVDVRAEDGRILRWDINSTLATGEDGEPIGFHAIARDVTERHAFEERQRLLINELNHRVKNTLALVQGLALQSFRGDGASAAAQAAFQARLAALAAAHDLLTRERWEGATLSDLIADATRPHAGPGRIAFDGPNLVLNPKAAVSLVLALNELATNAAKYGALSTSEGRVDIGWSLAEERLRLEWRESGGPAVRPPDTRGFGLKMIERALASDLGGTVAVRFEASGLVCAIDAPLPVAAAGAMPL